MQYERVSFQKLHMVSSDVIDGSLNFSIILGPCEILVKQNNKQSKCETKNGTENLWKAFWSLPEALPAISAKMFHVILVPEKRDLNFFFILLSNRNFLETFPGN